MPGRAVETAGAPRVAFGTMQPAGRSDRLFLSVDRQRNKNFFYKFDVESSK
jgi:hypothetical protein